MTRHHPLRWTKPASRWTQLSLLLVALLLATACAHTGPMSGIVDYDTEHDFASVEKLAFYEDEYPHERPPSEGRKKARAELERQLTEKGFEWTDFASADLWVIYHTGRRAKATFHSGTDPNLLEASLAIEMRDPKTRRSAWYGTVTQTWRTGDDLDERVRTAVGLLVDQFPPDASAGEIKIRE